MPPCTLDKRSVCNGRRRAIAGSSSRSDRGPRAPPPGARKSSRGETTSFLLLTSRRARAADVPHGPTRASQTPPRFSALSMSLSVLLRLGPPSGPSISRTLMPGRVPFAPPLLPPLPLPPPPSRCGGGGVRPASKVGGRTWGGCRPPGNGGKPLDEVLPCGETEARPCGSYE